MEATHAQAQHPRGRPVVDVRVRPCDRAVVVLSGLDLAAAVSTAERLPGADGPALVPVAVLRDLDHRELPDLRLLGMPSCGPACPASIRQLCSTSPLEKKSPQAG